MKIVGTDQAYEDLANAIILSAVKDYKSALIHQARNPDSKSAMRHVEREEKFFFSSWYEMLTDLDPTYLIRKLKETINEKYGQSEGEIKREEDIPCT